MRHVHGQTLTKNILKTVTSQGTTIESMRDWISGRKFMKHENNDDLLGARGG